MNEEIRSFISFQNGNSVVALKGNIIAILLFSIPTAFWGIGKQITKFLITPFVILFIGWTLYLFFNTDKKQRNYYLYLGTTSIYLTIILILAIYKLLSSLMKISLFILLIAYAIISIITFIYIVSFIKIIKKGFYLKKHNSATFIVLTPFCVIGMLAGKIISKYLNQNSNIIIICIILLFIALSCSMGSLNILKYYYLRKYN